MSIDLYKKASKGYHLKHVKPANTQLAAYVGSKLRVVRQIRIRVWRDSCKCQLDSKLVHNEGIRPIIGRKAFVGMQNIRYYHS